MLIVIIFRCGKFYKDRESSQSSISTILQNAAIIIPLEFVNLFFSTQLIYNPKARNTILVILC